MEIRKYEEQYARQISDIVLSNMYAINIKDHGKAVIDRISVHFTPDAIRQNFPRRTACFVAVEGETVLGTASIDRLWGDDTGEKFIVLTVFVRMDMHRYGIGRQLMEAVEAQADALGARELRIPASVYGCEFYRRLGYDFLDGRKERNDEGEYMLVKYL